MQYRTLGKTGIKVSALGYGAMRLPLKPGGSREDVDEQKAVGCKIDAKQGASDGAKNRLISGCFSRTSSCWGGLDGNGWPNRAEFAAVPCASWEKSANFCAPFCVGSLLPNWGAARIYIPGNLRRLGSRPKENESW